MGAVEEDEGGPGRELGRARERIGLEGEERREVVVWRKGKGFAR